MPARSFAKLFFWFILFFFLQGGLAEIFSQVSPPQQPASGPGGSNYFHQSVSKKKYGTGATAFWIYEPANPKPDSANLIIFNHGWGALNPACYGKWISHMVRKGNIVVFPKWQNDLTTLPQDFTPNSISSVKTAMDTLNNGSHVHPRYYNTAYIGYSFGGVISSNLAILADSAGIPAPKALLVCNGGNGNTGGAELPSYANMPDIMLLIIAGQNDIVVADTFGRMLFDSAVLVNPPYKNHITTYFDGHGFPAVESTHNEPLSWDSAYYSWDFFDNNSVVAASYAVSKTDAVDFFCYWKFSDAITDCAFYGNNCDYAFCNTPEQRYLGTWSDSQPVVEMFVETKTPCSGISAGEIIYANDFFRVYPNPNDGNFNLRFPETLPPGGFFSLEIRNVLGEIVFRSETCSRYGTAHTGLSLNCAPGFYALTVRTGEKFFSEKIMVR